MALRRTVTGESWPREARGPTAPVPSAVCLALYWRPASVVLLSSYASCYP